MTIRATSILIAASALLIILLPSLAIAAEPQKESPASHGSATSEKRAMTEDYKKLRIEREKLVIERAQLNISCLEAKEADKKDCVEKKRALRDKIEKISDKVHDLREKRRMERRASETGQGNNGKDGKNAKP